MTKSRIQLWPPLMVGALFAAVFALITARTQNHVDALALLRNTPRATLEKPANGPAIYTGKLRGPTTRVDPSGTKAAGFWWWVDERTGKSSWKNVCFFREINGMRVVDGNVEAKLVMFDTKEGLALVGPKRTNDFDARLIVDLGYEQPLYPKPWPAVASNCAGKSREYIQRSMPDGAPVEVFACFADGELRPCASAPATVMALGTMAQHRARRATEASVPYVAVSMVALAMLIALFIVNAYRRGKFFEIVSPTRSR